MDRLLKGAWPEPFMPALKPHLPPRVLALGFGFLVVAACCGLRHPCISRKR